MKGRIWSEGTVFRKHGFRKRGSGEPRSYGAAGGEVPALNPVLAVDLFLVDLAGCVAVEGCVDHAALAVRRASNLGCELVKP
ncbi:hypothetical protein PLANPX_0230 [Lacipirellula parvula]|uniref:Uncharacterized protein n=1 Tax=Lacipirellula parvula TaxID=2650471 RepID=A0A5K7X1T2_9BACT|nr:hypothetical protein PLANPX_0230 [Lacipirellula parvula]